MQTASDDYLAQLSAWKVERLAHLTAPDGWLNLTDRVPLSPGASRIGSAAGNDVVLSVGPGFIGTITLEENRHVAFAPAEGGAVISMELDRKNWPRFRVGDLLLEVMVTGEETALRVRDTRSPRRANFPGLDYFPPDPAWRIVADWVAFDAPLAMVIDTTKSIATNILATHRAVFSHAGKRVELIATHGKPEGPQFVLRDATSRDRTYPAARFLIGEPMADNKMVLDFNKAFNPPCSFTDHAVCPLPPPENILPFAIPAGELKPR